MYNLTANNYIHKQLETWNKKWVAIRIVLFLEYLLYLNQHQLMSISNNVD